MKKWHVGLKLLAIVLSIFLALPGNILAAAAAKPTVKIKHDPPKYYIPGFRIILDADIEDETEVLVARCYFKTKHEKSPLFVDMIPKGNPGYQAELPAPWINSEAIDYRFVVVDKDKKVVATQLFTMKEKETEQAAAWKEVSEVQEVRLDQAQEVLEKYEVIKKDLEREYADKLPKWQRAASEGQLAVLTELEIAASDGVRGFYDDLFLTEVSGPSKYGLLAEGLYTDVQIAAAGGETSIAASTGAVSAGTITATGVIGMGTIALGALALGGLAAAGGGGGGGGGSSGGSSDGGNGGGGSTAAPPADVTGTWAFQIRCQGSATNIISLNIVLNETLGGDYSGSGTGTDTNGDTLSITISGNYNSSTNFLSGEITADNLTTPGLPRIDNFSTTLTSNDTGWIPTNCLQSCGCAGEIRMVKQ